MAAPGDGLGAAAPAPALTLTVPRRFHGPRASGNGGYVAGRLAQFVPADGPVTVTLRRPPPLDTPMDVVPGERGGVRLMAGPALVAAAEPGQLDVADVVPVDFATAERAASGYRGLAQHPFPGCFGCGPERAEGDGLRLAPGPLPDRPESTAAAWVPHPSLAVPAGADTVPPEIAWTALDCPGGWTVDLGGRPMVLGQLTAQLEAAPYVGDRCVVVGRLVARDGRKARTETTLFDGDGRVLARAAAVWVEIDPAAFGG